ncbi:hypothetical protein RJ641_015496 [Dillenia turbinata]|uniref:Protein kinase domain-containing protein n=1 Tax=Dillenia turbinata TaxID=194707 RepID=A0AAN8Z0A1_9MAGN
MPPESEDKDHENVQEEEKSKKESNKAKESFSLEELKLYTNNFSEDNFIGNTQYGKLYRGIIPSGQSGLEEGTVITIKITENHRSYAFFRMIFYEYLWMNERCVQRKEEYKISHPNMTKWIGVGSLPNCQMAIVYDLEPMDTVYNLITKDNFTWLKRIKVAIGFGCLLKYFHNQPRWKLIVHNIDAAHIIVDKNYNPTLVDYFMSSCGILNDRHCIHRRGSYGYVDPHYAVTGVGTDKCDVFAFGVLLLGLIAKRVYTEEDRLCGKPFVYEWAQSNYKPRKSIFGIFGQSRDCLVHQSFGADATYDPCDGFEITKIAMQCVEYDPMKRPNMMEVCESLQRLLVVKRKGSTTAGDEVESQLGD